MVPGDAEIADIVTLMARGEFMAAYDAASAIGSTEMTAIEPSVRSRLGYLRALALARTGATNRAEAEIDQLMITAEDVPGASGAELAALKARIIKDRAIALGGDDRARTAGLAARHYEAVFQRFGTTFSCVNAATMWRLGGDVDRAEGLAAEAQRRATIDAASASTEIDAYWAAASAAEAALVAEDLDRAARAIERAGALEVDNYAARATTRKQLLLLCDLLGVDGDDLLAPIANPEVIHYCGHLMAPAGRDGRFIPADEAPVRVELTKRLGSRRVGDAYGSLAAGADIIAAEVLLEVGADLHVVLPFSAEEFVGVSVNEAGTEWAHRFRRCLDEASSVTVTCESAYLGDDELFGFATKVAMGQAINRGVRLSSRISQIAVWDGQPTGLPAGTAHDVDAWRATGYPTEVIAVEPRSSQTLAPRRQSSRRPVRALLFGDLHGFSQLHDEEMIGFIDHVLGPIAATLDSFGPSVVDRNTWGDGLFVAIDDVSVAASVAIGIQETLAGINLPEHGLPGELRMRLAAHVGPVIAMHDPVRQQAGTFGRELTRTARIEPRTPAGEVYATTMFAALLVLDRQAAVAPEYVGILTTANGFETTPLYVLKRRRRSHRPIT